MPLKPCGLPIERVNGGEPLIQPTQNWWESGVTFNSAAVYLPRSEENDPIIATLAGADRLDDPRLLDGIVALHYRARPAADPGYRWCRSFVGLALFTPELQPLWRRPCPVIEPGAAPTDQDYLGVEDPRITRIGDTFHAVYCGAADFPEGEDWKTANCHATSKDLLHWQKHGPLCGTLSDVCNKDGVLFPERVGRRYVLLHRPMVGPIGGWCIHAATCPALDGVWTDCGAILRPTPGEGVAECWVGAGSVPIPLGGMRYLAITHTGNRLEDGERAYQLDAAILDLERLHAADGPVVSYLERLLTPETEYETHAPYSDSVANAVFTCGSYVYRNHLYIVYGGGDTCILGLRLPLAALLDRLTSHKSVR